jgi:hypothetical protein
LTARKSRRRRRKRKGQPQTDATVATAQEDGAAADGRIEESAGRVEPEPEREPAEDAA